MKSVFYYHLKNEYIEKPHLQLRTTCWLKFFTLCYYICRGKRRGKKCWNTSEKQNDERWKPRMKVSKMGSNTFLSYTRRLHLTFFFHIMTKSIFRAQEKCSWMIQTLILYETKNFWISSEIFKKFDENQRKMVKIN